VLGPQDIKGLESGAVIRTWRGRGDGCGAELLPVCRPQPSRSTMALQRRALAHAACWVPATLVMPDRPQRAGSSGRKLPAFGTDGRLGRISVSVNLLPPLDQAFAWAHVHVYGSSTLRQPTRRSTPYIAGNRTRASRCELLCPRKLEPRTVYWAFLVPIFGSGRLAGLGEAPRLVRPTRWPEPWRTHRDHSHLLRVAFRDRRRR